MSLRGGGTGRSVSVGVKEVAVTDWSPARADRSGEFPLAANHNIQSSNFWSGFQNVVRHVLSLS